MTQYCIIVHYQWCGNAEKFKTKNFTSVVAAKDALASIEESLDNAEMFQVVNTSRIEKGFMRTLNFVKSHPSFHVNLISLYYKYDGEWMHIDPAIFCNRCGRLLTDPESIRLGYGPECAQKIHARRISNENVSIEYFIGGR